MRTSIKTIFCVTCLVLTLTACASSQKPATQSRLTMGEVKRNIVKGETNQAEILSLFGSPNLVSKNKSNNEIWAYNKMSFDSEKGSASIMGGLFGTGGLGVGAASKAISSSSSKSFDLIITFDRDDVVKDYKVVYSSY